MSATEKTFNELRIFGFLALLLIIILSGLCCYLIACINEVWSITTGIVGFCLLMICLLGFMEIEAYNARVMLFFRKYKGTITNVSMVQLALNKLDKENVVELDEERKAAMVNNLLVVLCADESARPVVNTGILHH